MTIQAYQRRYRFIVGSDSASETLTTGRNTASATHSVTVADAARDHDLADAAAQYQQTSGQISATGALATALATPAVQ